MDEELLTTKQVEVYTGGILKVATLNWWRHAGDNSLKWGRIGPKKIVYRKSDVDAFIAAAFDVPAGVQASA